MNFDWAELGVAGVVIIVCTSIIARAVVSSKRERKRMGVEFSFKITREADPDPPAED